MKLFTEVAEQYEDFAAHASDSPCFADWATRVAADPDVLAWIGRLPPIKQQPNIVFAAARWCGVPAPGPYAGLREALLAEPPYDAGAGRGDAPSIIRTILSRSTQTNEVGRLATLAPVFARIAAEAGRPLALLEAGTSAGVCLYPDRYGYRYLVGEDRAERVWAPGPSAATGTPAATASTAAPDAAHRPAHPPRDASIAPDAELTCRVKGDFDVPTGGIPVAWRGGIDLAPIDARDDDATSWLENLVWPEQDARRANLRTALGVVRDDPPHLRRGDILTDLDDAIDEAAALTGGDAEVVVFHTAVAAYLEPEDRERFAAAMAERVAAGRCRWVSNEGANVLPGVTATGPAVPAGHPTFVLGLDGRALAWTHGHGRSMTWFG